MPSLLTDDHSCCEASSGLLLQQANVCTCFTQQHQRLGLCLGPLTGCLALLKQENLETSWAAEGRASVLDPPQALLGNMPADSTALWVGH